jgi:hypothetical protein
MTASRHLWRRLMADGGRCLGRSKPQEQNDGIPIVACRVLARNTERRQILAEGDRSRYQNRPGYT